MLETKPGFPWSRLIPHGGGVLVAGDARRSVAGGTGVGVAERYRTLFETMAQGVVYQNADGYITDANPAAVRILGLSLAEMRGLTSIDPHGRAVHQDRSAFSGETHPAMVALRTGQPVSGVVMGVLNSEEDSYRWIRIHAVPEFRSGEAAPYQVYTTFDDVTEQRRREEAIRFQAHLLDTVEQAVIATDLDGTIRYWNRYAEQLYGWSATEVLGRNVLDVTPSQQTQAHAAEILGSLAVGEGWTGEFLVQRRDGTTFPALVTDSPIRDARGQLVGIVGVSVDVTERKQTERALQASEARFRALIEQSSESVLMLDPDGQLLYAGPSTSRLLGYAEEELVGRSAFELLHSEDVDPTAQALALVVEQPDVRATVQYRVRHADGSWRWYESVVTNLLAEPSVQALVVNSREITQRRQLEEELRQAQKLDAVGQLAGGIAHDFN
ncbi:MAG: PAS domain S-box protein, partial [Chloroflexi bacterium]|nr:PAS domain S-box protein [Chloroflexota bacterium]